MSTNELTGVQPYEPRDPPYGEMTPHLYSYFYWDSLHGTSAVNAYIAEAAYYATIQAAIPEPSLTALSAGVIMLLFVWVRRRKA